MEREAERDKLTGIIVNDLQHVGLNLEKVQNGLGAVNAALTENTNALRKLNGKGT